MTKEDPFHEPLPAETELEMRHAALREMVERDRQSAWQIAHYERSQRDEYTSKLRFGLATLNAASLVTVLNLSAAFAGMWPAAPVIAAGIYFLGTLSAGSSLFAHQTRLIELVGDTSARAMILDRAASLCAFPVGSAENARLGEAMEQAHAHAQKTFPLSMSAIYMQHTAALCWASAFLLLGVAKIASLFPAPAWAPWLAVG
ncbi:hypothetical protein HRJ34_00315 [Rhizorhabdus wittichii]|uniref:Uncharacterized protein n=1 Tax=Rhizorhabdus wittichii TaxID=160791 RepID=A0A975D386_9SPHN|nr:hypothetical protein [Rhizorhabdus wittichii]QTH22023.1 hypothetical protein HRJ34_00315 [Rhizorhabdus wittichii]